MLAFGMVILGILACNLLDKKSNPIIIRRILPTLTPTVKPDPSSTTITPPTPEVTSLPLSQTVGLTMTAESLNNVGLPSPSPETDLQQTSNEANKVVPTDPTIVSITTPTPGAADWSFAGVEVYPDEFGEGLILYGNAINETSFTQELNVITATFFDGQGQVIADAGNTVDYWPIDVIPAKAQLPFSIRVPDVKSAANFELSVQAQAGTQTPRQNFQVSNLEQQQLESGYCLMGQVQNNGDPLQKYLIVIAVLYDSQNRVLQFGEYYASDPTLLQGDRQEPFEICIDSASQPVARHELRVWGE